MSTPVFDTLVFSGGGTAVISFVGCVRYLEHLGALDAVRTFVGTSAGAILAMLCAVGLSADEVAKWLVDGGGVINTLNLEGVLEFSERLGIDDGAATVACLSAVLRRRFGRDDMTFVELAKLTGRSLVVCAVNVLAAKHQFFGVDTSPHVSVLTAVRMSFGVPVLFTPVWHQGGLFVDGGLFDNLPLDHQQRPAATCTLALRSTCWHARPPAVEPGDVSIGGYMAMIASALLRRANEASAVPAAGASDTPGRIVRVVDVLPYGGAAADPTTSFGFCPDTLSFKLDEAVVSAHVQHGYEAMDAARVFDVEACSRRVLPGEFLMPSQDPSGSREGGDDHAPPKPRVQ